MPDFRHMLFLWICVMFSNIYERSIFYFAVKAVLNKTLVIHGHNTTVTRCHIVSYESLFDFLVFSISITHMLSTSTYCENF